MKERIIIENAKSNEFDSVGTLMVEAYSKLNGFPKPDEQPAYYAMLRNIGRMTENPNTELLVAKNMNEQILGAVVYFSDMKYYGSGGTATQEKNASGFRLLAVDSKTRGQGIGKLLTKECILRAKANNSEKMIIHTTNSMKIAWKMYEKLGFIRAKDLDFMQEQLEVFGFRLKL